MNPYRDAFYSRQAEWHRHGSTAALARAHRARSKYFRWYTHNWLPDSKDGAVLDIGCGAGQFVYFLTREGYLNVQGVDRDKEQVKMARALGLNCTCGDAIEFLTHVQGNWNCISLLDVLEHLTVNEMHALLSQVAPRLEPGGRVILSVPNADSPQGLSSRYSDITHENAFSVTSMSEALFCHGLQSRSVRDPWPAPVSCSRRIFRSVALAARSLEAARLRLLGLSVPRVWSAVFWMMATKAGS